MAGGARSARAVREAARSKPNEAGSATSELASVGGREAAGAPRTRSEAESAGAEHRAAEDGTVRNRRPRSDWSPEDTERSEVRRGETPGR